MEIWKVALIIAAGCAVLVWLVMEIEGRNRDDDGEGDE